MSVEESPGFTDPLKEYAKTSLLEALGSFRDDYRLEPNEFIIIGGANLVIREIIERTPDIDLLVPESVWGHIYEFGKAKGRQLTLPSDKSILRGADSVGVAFPETAYGVPISANCELGDGAYPLDYETIINERSPEGTMILDDEGITLLSMEHVIGSKKALGRTRDSYHLRKIFEKRVEANRELVEATRRFDLVK